MTKIYLLSLTLIYSGIMFSQGITNNGANIYIADGAFVHGGNFINLTAGDNPEIDLNGTLELKGDWINNSTTENLFINIESTPNGTLILSGTNETIISGNTKTFFENLSIENAIKSLQISNCEVNGILSINGILDLNSNRLILNNNNFDINYVSGYILSETTPFEGLGELEIKIDEAESTYNIPFGSGDEENNLNISFTTNTAAGSSSGSVVFATYPTDTDNEPLPESNYYLGDISTNKTIDRFWKIAPDYSVNPDISLNIFYTDPDLEANDIDENNLKLIRYNSEDEVWNDIVYSPDINDINNNATVETIPGSSFFSWWTFAEVTEIIPDFFIPNGITPNDDGYNDTWIIDNLPENTQVIIYNRWGDEVFRSDNYIGEWGGANQPSGAYYYIITLTDGQTFSGDVNILK